MRLVFFLPVSYDVHREDGFLAGFVKLQQQLLVFEQVATVAGMYTTIGGSRRSGGRSTGPTGVEG